MDPIELLQQKLARHPELRYELTDNSITVAPPSDEGFSVSFFATPIEYVVYFEGWHEHFETVEKALDCFSFAYSGQCRLRVVYRGSTAVRWELQSRDIDGWVSDTEVGLLLHPILASTSCRLPTQPKSFGACLTSACSRTQQNRAADAGRYRRPALGTLPPWSDEI